MASSKNPVTELGLLAAFVALTVMVVVAAQRIRAWGLLRKVVQRLENTSSQLGVWLVITFALAFAVVAEHFGLATILGTFLAGVIVRRMDELPVFPGGFPGQAGSDRLQIPDPGVLREHRRRPRRNLAVP